MLGRFLRPESFFFATAISGECTKAGSRLSETRTVCVAIESNGGMFPPKALLTLYWRQ